MANYDECEVNHSFNHQTQDIAMHSRSDSCQIPREPLDPQSPVLCSPSSEDYELSPVIASSRVPSAAIDGVSEPVDSPIEDPATSKWREPRRRDPEIDAHRSRYRELFPGNHHIRRSRDNVYWRTPAMAVGSFLSGSSLAVGHHLFLVSLDGRPNHNQSWTNRFSLAFAFSTTTLLSAGVAIALKQKLWYTFRKSKKGVAIGTIDSFLEIQLNPFNFFVLDVWRSGLLATVLAVLFWMFPFVPLISPTSLSTAIASTITNIDCVVPNIDFNLLNQGRNLSRISLADTHGTDGVGLASPIARKLASLTAYNGNILNWASPCGSNCSYGIQFNGPSWRCSHSSNDNNSAIDAFRDNITSTFAGSIWVTCPSYLAAFSNSTGDFWMGRSKKVDQDDKAPNQGLEIDVFYCENWNTTYNVWVNYTSSIQRIEIVNLTHLNNFSVPYILETTETNGMNTIPVPGEFQNAIMYNHAALFRSLGELLAGSIMRMVHGEPLINTNLASIPRLSTVNASQSLSNGRREGVYGTVADMRSAVEELSRNLTVSLLASPLLQIASNTTTRCQEENIRIVWEYDPKILWIPYGMAISVALGCLVIGALAILGNHGIIYENSFSTVLRTTRNQELDALIGNDSSGSQPLSKELAEVRLRLEERGGEVDRALSIGDDLGPGVSFGIVA